MGDVKEERRKEQRSEKGKGDERGVRKERKEQEEKRGKEIEKKMRRK